ncbi:MAG TPA: sulfatase-like hydrolase/transferase [Allosphingosinicella sp.]|jgi:lipid A ethanolaminephosphotransferase
MAIATLRRDPRIVKPALIGLYLLWDAPAIGARVASLGVSPELGVYVLLLALLAGALMLAAFIRPVALRVIVALLLCAASLFQQSVEWSTAGILTYDGFANMIEARGNIADALAQYGGVLWHTLPPTLILAAGLLLPPGPRGRRAWPAAAAPPAAVLALSAIFYLRGGEGSRGLPAAFTPVSYTVLMGLEQATAYHGPRDEVTIARPPTRPDRDIVLIVDESISGNYLDIDNDAGVDSGLATPPAGVVLANYGYAASIHNCSATVNQVLRFGGTRENYRDTIVRGPSLWRYAKKAGMRTVYLDAQSTGGALQNLMSSAERAEIDDFEQFGAVPVVDRDMAAADALARHINNGVPELIYVNKLGAHFPVADKFPDAYYRYQPGLPRGRQAGIAWTSDRTGFHGTPEEWVQYRNSYRNTLLWNVGGFFRRLFAEADLRRATIIYTSDHGQDLHERRNPGINTHCGTRQPVEQEGLVPLVVIDGRASADWSRTLPTNRNGMSGFRIFPTLLSLMGYDRAGVKAHYGPAIDDPTPDPFSFIVRFNRSLGGKPTLQHIDLAKVITPPESDFQRLANAGPAAAR